MNASPLFAASIGVVRVGKVAPLGPRAVPSAFVKSPVSGAVSVGPLGLAGDEQADHSVHGGPDKAVYAYAARHYPDWAADFPALAPRFVPGSMGENLSIAGLDEDMVCIGDHIAHGSVVLQVTQPRLPCFKLALAFGNPKLVRAMTQSGRSGWYCRVLVPAALAAGDPLTLIERPNPAWTVTRFNALLRGRPNVALCAEAAALTGLSAVWRAELTQ